MGRDNFEDKVLQELEKLNRVQVVHFAWRCAVRVLPFFASTGSFEYFGGNQLQNHIYTVFHLLDMTIAVDKPNDSAAANMGVAAAADAAVGNVAFYVIVAAYRAARVAEAVNDADRSTAIAQAVEAFQRATATAARNAKKKIDIESVILHDLNTIQERDNNKNIQPEDTHVYGDIWDNFLKALAAEECAYWGQLYQRIFDNGFVLDIDASEKRVNVPKEIKKLGAAAVANYLEELEKGGTRLNEARIIILGDKGAGKTCLARKLIDPQASMTTNNESTAGVDTTVWELKKEKINVSVWDFAGHTVTHAVHQFFLSERCLYIMVYDGRTEERNRLEYWLNHMKNYGGNSKAIILVNTRDQHSVDIPINSLIEQYPIEGFYSFSIQDDEAALKTFRNDVARYIKNNPSWKQQEIPTSFYRVKDKLENLFAKGEKEKGREHITRDEFNKIALICGVDTIEKFEKLLEGLNSLGVSLWYKNMEEFDTLVLNPEWISYGVYSIINWINEKNQYSLTLREFSAVFNNASDRYPVKKHKFLFKLMKHYELAYETKNEKELIVPHLLKEDRPKDLPNFPVGESLMLRYKAEQPLPPNTISRFIIRHNQDIKKEKSDYLVWRYGVVLKDKNNSIALVREEDRTISVAVKGKSKTHYISTLRETLDDIFDSYKSKKPELQYRIERFGEIPSDYEAKNPLWLSNNKIINHYKNEKPYYDDSTNQDIPMDRVVNLFKIESIEGGAILGGMDNAIIKTTYNFRDCNINLQGNLNELAQLLTESGNTQEAKELENAAIALEQAENSVSKEEVKKKGIANRLKRLVAALENEDSNLHKTVKGIKNGVSIAQDIAKGYNDIAQWAGLPQVPKPFLK